MGNHEKFTVGSRTRLLADGAVGSRTNGAPRVSGRSNGRPLKVLQIASFGMEFFHEQVRILEELGVECDTLYPGDFRESGHIHGNEGLHERFLRKIYGHNLLYYGVQGSLFYPKVLRASVANQYDIVHVNSGIVAPLGLLQPTRPIVMTFWGDDLLGDRLGGLQPEITKFCAKRGDQVIVRSQEMKDALPCDAEIIPSGVDLSVFKPMDQTEAQDAVGWSSTDRHVLFPYSKGREKKRYPLAKQIVEQVNESFGEPVQLQLVHDVSHHEMPLYYNAADVLLLPSLREGSPNTVKEAMACNVPVVSTDVGDTRERLSPVSNSYVCAGDDDLDDALLAVLEADERSDGRAYVEEVSLERMGERIVAIYESLLVNR